MKEFKYVITDSEGIHARPAGELIKEAKKYACSIKIQANGKVGDCKKIFTVMALGVKKGQEVTLTFEGDDEEQACQAISTFLKENL